MCNLVTTDYSHNNEKHKAIKVFIKFISLINLTAYNKN